MDNKRFYKKISTFFWFVLAIMPIISTLIQCCFVCFNSFQNVTLSDIANFGASSMDDLSFANVFVFQLENAYIFLIPSFIRTPMENLFSIIDSGLSDAIALYVSWFAWIYILELLCDIFTWVQRWIHNFLSKWGV